MQKNRTLSMRSFLMMRFPIKYNIHQNNNNRQQRVHNSYIVTYFSKINHNIDSSLINKLAARLASKSDNISSHTGEILYIFSNYI